MNTAALLSSSALAAAGLLAVMPLQAEVKERLIEVRTQQGTNMATSVSPDERKIVMDLQGTLWTLSIDGGNADAITDALIESRNPVWSPAGDWIAYQCYVQDNWHICVGRPDRSEMRVLTAGAYDHRDPYWAPDGKSIMFVSDREGNYDIWTVELEGLTLRKITETEEDEGFPSVSPDGKVIAYVVTRKDGSSIRLIREGTVETLLESPNALALPTWSPDGNEITYLEFDAAAGVGVLKGLSTIDKSVRNLSGAGEDVFHSRLAWMQDGSLVYAANGGILRRNPFNGAVREIPFEVEFELVRHDYPARDVGFDRNETRAVKGIYNPMMSPDGVEVAFSALGDIWVQRLAGEGLRQVTHDAFMQIDPAWSPDGKSIAYASDHGSAGTMQLWLYDLNSGEHRKLHESPDNVSLPTFSPDGQQIAFLLSDAPDWHARYVHVIDLATGDVRKVYEWLFMPGRPAWTPDGKSIVLSAQRTYTKRFRKGFNEFLSVNVASGSDRWWTPFPDQSLDIRGTSGPSWSPDGSNLAYVFNGQLWISPTDPAGEPVGPPRRVTSELANAISWSGDSRSILFLSGPQFRQVFLDDGRIVSHATQLNWAPSPSTKRIVIRAGRLFDGVSKTYRRDVDIRIEGDRIKEVVRKGKNWKDAVVIDATGKTVLPGLIESHIHQFAANGERTGRLPFSFGVTSMREVGADPYEAQMFKESWASGALIGPRQFYSGLLEGSRVYYSMSLPITTGPRLEQELERALQLDYDLIKTYERLSDYNQRRVVEFAHEHGLTVTSHELYPAAAYGADGVEHFSTQDRRSRLDGDRFSPGGRTYEDVLGLLSASGMAFTPTSFWGRDRVMASEGWSPMQTRQFAQLLPERFHSLVGLDAGPNRPLEGLIKSLNQRQSLLREVFERGGTIIAGTDTSFYLAGLSLILEINELKLAGLPAHEALKSATIRAAIAMGVGTELGSIESGKLADIVIVDGDPLENPMDLVRVHGVMKGGTYFPLEDLLPAR